MFFLFFFPLLFPLDFPPLSLQLLSLHSSSSAIRYSLPRGAVSHLWSFFFNHRSSLCVVVLLCPVVLWEDVMWERCSAEPGAEECHPPQKTKPRLGRKKGENSMEKAGFGKSGEVFLSGLLSWMYWGC